MQANMALKRRPAAVTVWQEQVEPAGVLIMKQVSGEGREGPGTSSGGCRYEHPHRFTLLPKFRHASLSGCFYFVTPQETRRWQINQDDMLSDRR